ncbi:MAG: thymidylate kinase [Selenomonadaceae bacterium]|nr:thymidylate kinase [Selenomonadaceae bacterium]
MPKGKLIIVEAGDASGKATQTHKLLTRLWADGYPAHKISFPDYESEASAPVRMYLRGDFGDKAEGVNPYAASVFYAVDRYASFQTAWRKFYEAGDIIIADRYTTSNMVHQGIKIAAGAARENFLTWLFDLEYNKLGLPQPDGVVFLDMEPKAAEKLLAARAKERGASPDIHEANLAYLRRCHAAYTELAKKYGWRHIICSEGGIPRSVDDIHAAVYEAVTNILLQ